MRKVSTFLASAAMMLAGTAIGNAQQYYDPLNWPGDGIAEVEVGQNVVLQAANFQEGRFYNGEKNSKKISEKCLYTFEKAESDLDGKPTYYLKQVSTGFYLQGKDWANGSVKFAKSKFKAQPVWVQKAQEFYYRNKANGANDDEWPEDGVEDWTTAAIYDSAHYKKTPPEGAFIISLSDQPKYFFNNFWGDGAALWQYPDTNTWFICEVEKLMGIDRLDAMFSDLFPTGKVDLYKVGSEAGEVPAEAAEQAEAAVAATQALLESEMPDDAACEQAADKLFAAYENYMKSVIGVNSGYYLIHDYRCEMDNPEWNYIFFDSYLGQSFLSLKQFPNQDKTPNVENLTAKDAMYVWHFEKQEDGKYKVKSFASDDYVQAKMKKLHPNNVERYFLITKDASEAGEFVIEPSPKFKGGFNITVGPDFSDRHGMWNTARNGKFWGICEWRDYNDTGSTWKFTPVSADVINPLKDAVKESMEKVLLKARNDKMGTLLASAKSAYHSNEKYITVEGVDNVSAEGVFNFNNPGLCPDAAMLSSNAADQDEGQDIGVLVDNNKNTYFHTTWHSSQEIKEPHYIQFELTEGVKTAAIQLLKRQNATGELKEIKVVASNNPDADANDWTEIGVFGVNYNKDAQMPNPDDPELLDTLKNNAALVGFEMPEAYQYIRMISVRNAQGGATLGYPWMHMAEARVYPAVYDAEGSLNFAVAKEVKENLLASIEKGEGELKDSLTTQATLELLTKAYEAYQKATPKPQVVKDLYNKYQKFCNNAEEGDELGFFEEGAKDEFQAVIDEVKGDWKEAMTLQEVQTAVKTLEDGFKAFNAKLNKPEAGQYYRIVCAADGKDAEGNPVFQYGHYLYASNSGATPIHWGGRTDEGADEEGLENKLEFYWKVIENGDGTYKLQNAAYGTYLSNAEEANAAPVSMRLKDDSISVSFTSFKPGTFNIELLQNRYVNINPGKDNRKVLTWGDPGANSLFTFQPAEEWDADEALARVWAGNGSRIKTMPYAVNPEGAMDAKLYSVLGVNKPSDESCRIYLEFKECKDIIPAGTPFVMVADSIENEDGDLAPVDWASLQVAGVEEGLADIKYTREAGKQECNGSVLSGCFVPEKVGAGTFFINGKGNLILVVEKEGKTGYNSGWFSTLAPTKEVGDYHLQVDPDTWTMIESGIGGVEVDVVNGKIFDLQGRQVQKAEKGVYIINGKKVLK